MTQQSHWKIIFSQKRHWTPMFIAALLTIAYLQDSTTYLHSTRYYLLTIALLTGYRSKLNVH